MTRLGAFGIHLGISLLIFAVLGYLILFHWYPDFFFASDGGWQGIRIVAFVDMVLGPTLTLVVYNPSKPAKELGRDLSIIAVIQLSCLAAGTYVVYSERPIAMVYSDGTFYSMTADDYREAGQAIPDLHAVDDRTPPWVTVQLPEDANDQSRIRRTAMQSSTPLRTLSEFYASFSLSHVDRARDGLTWDQLETRDRATPFMDQFLAEHGGHFDDYVFLAFGTRYRLALIALRRKDGALIYLDIPDVPPIGDSKGKSEG